MAQGSRPDSTAPRRGASRWRLVVPLALMLAIAVASEQPLPVGLEGGSDKLVHAAVYGALSLSWTFALAGGIAARCIAGGLLSTLWGGLDELHQSFVPGRDASFADAAADAAGAGLAAVGGFLRGRRRGRS